MFKIKPYVRIAEARSLRSLWVPVVFPTDISGK